MIIPYLLGVELSLACLQDVALVKGIVKRIGNELKRYTDLMEDGIMKSLGVVMKARQLADLT